MQPHIADVILFTIRKEVISEHGMVTICIDSNLVFGEKRTNDVAALHVAPNNHWFRMLWVFHGYV